MKDDIKKDFANPSNVIADNLAITPQSIKAILPSRRNIRRILNYSSTKDIPREPLTVSELVIPDNLKKIGTKIFWIFDTKNRFEHNRILMFGVRETLNLLEQCGFNVIKTFTDFDMNNESEQADRLFFVAQKQF